MRLVSAYAPVAANPIPATSAISTIIIAVTVPDLKDNALFIFYFLAF